MQRIHDLETQASAPPAALATPDSIAAIIASAEGREVRAWHINAANRVLARLNEPPAALASDAIEAATSALFDMKYFENKPYRSIAETAVRAYLAALLPPETAALVEEAREVANSARLNRSAESVTDMRIMLRKSAETLEKAANALEAQAALAGDAREDCANCEHGSDDVCCGKLDRPENEPPAAREGYVLVPREPTEAMMDDGRRAVGDDLYPTKGECGEIYRAMIAAAPPSEPPAARDLTADEDRMLNKALIASTELVEPIEAYSKGIALGVMDKASKPPAALLPPETKGLVERLRHVSGYTHAAGMHDDGELAHKAAAAIEALQAQVAQLKAMIAWMENINPALGEDQP
jgi:hypothetical protein